MQLTGDRFTDVSAVFGNDLATMPNYPAEIRAPAGTIAGVSSLPGPHLRPRHPHPGRRAQRARRDEPRRAQGQPRRARAGRRRSSSTPTRSTSATSTRPATTANPLDDGSLAAYRVVQVPMTTITLEATKELGREAARRRAVEELLRPRPDLVDVHPAGRADRRVDRARSSRTAPLVRDANLAAFKAGLQLRRDRRAVRAPVRDRSPRSSTPGRVPQHHRQPRAVVRPDRRRPAGEPADPVRVVPDHPGVRHPPRAVEAQELRRAHAAGRGRDRGRRRRDRRRVRRSARRHRDQRSRRRPEVGGASASRSASSCRSSSSTCSAAARPPACPPRPSRPTSCSRCTAATARRRCRSSPRTRRATASTPRSRPCASRSKYRTPVILLTDGYLANGAEPWLLPDVDALPDISVPFATEPNHDGDVLALPARPRDARPPVGDPRHARPHAPHRWHREAGRHRQRQLRPREPRAHGAHLRADKVARIADDIPPVEVDDPTTTPSCSCSGGGARGARISRPSASVRGDRRARWPTRTSCT